MLFRVLGPVEVTVAGGDADPLSAEKPRRLLCMLLLHANTWVSTDALIGEIWPAGPPASAVGNVKSYISLLRQLLPPTDGTANRIDRRGNAYRLTVAPTELDATVFEGLVSAGEGALAAGDPATAVHQLTGALALWRGRPYESLDSEPASVVARLTELRCTAQDTLAVALVAVGRAAEAVTLLRGVIAENPLREPSWKHLMTALSAAGRRADALDAYHQARRGLAEALGVEPGADLQRLHHRLLREQSPAAPKPAPTTEAPPAPTTEPRPMATAAPAVSRARRWPRMLPTPLLVVLCAALLGVTATAAALTSDDPAARPTAAPVPSPAPSSGGAAPPGISPRRPVPGFATRDNDSKVLFGVGSQAVSALTSDLVQHTPAHLVTTWFHNPTDMDGLRGWRKSLVPGVYRAGNAMHLIIADWDGDDPAVPVETPHGLGCGQPYPLSDDFLVKVRELAQIFAGGPRDPPLYVTVFHGVNIYGCEDGSYLQEPATTVYLRALKDRYLEVREIFHAGAPNARVALGWQGWQAEVDEPETGGGRSMIGHFADVLRVSDFQSVVCWQKDDNIGPVRHMVHELGRYGPVLVEYGNDEVIGVYDRDMRALLNDGSLARLISDGLFAVNFSDNRLLTSKPDTYAFVKDTVRRRGAPARR